MSLDCVRYLLSLYPLSADLSLCFSEFITATTVDDAYEISCPAYAWEDVGADVEEGPGADISLASR